MLIKLTKKPNKPVFIIEKKKKNHLGFFDYNYDLTGNKNSATQFNDLLDCEMAFERSFRYFENEQYNGISQDYKNSAKSMFECFKTYSINYV